MSENSKIIREFIETWSSLDADRLASYFTDDGSYYNMPMEPVTGRENIREFIGGFLSTWSETDWEIRHILSAGDVVIAERIDKTKTSAGDVDLPCVGVFEMSNGKIRIWRDYFDLATYTNAMTT